MKSLKLNSWNFYFNEEKSDSIEIFQIVQRINTDGWQKVYQYKGKKVISSIHIILIGISIMYIFCTLMLT